MAQQTGSRFIMPEILRFWRDLPKELKAELKSKHNITIVNYHWIKMVWDEINNFKTK